MADGFAQIPPDSTGKKVDAASLDVGLNTVFRQRMIIGDNSATAQFATVTGGALMTTGTFNISAMPAVTLSGTATVAGVVALSGTATVAGSVNISVMPAVVLAAGTANIGTLNNISSTVAAILAAGVANIGYINNISATVSVVNGAGTANIGGVSLVAGTANIGFINNISATVTVAGVVGLTAGTAVIGDINAISRTVQVAVGTPFTLNDISRTVQVAVSTPFTVNDISATVTIAGSVNLGSIGIMSASHGPKCVTASTSAVVTLIASPGTGLSIYVTQLMVTNASATGTRARIGTSSSPLTVVGYMTSAGGGFVLNFNPPWKLSASEAALCSVKPNASQCDFTVNFYVAA